MADIQNKALPPRKVPPVGGQGNPPVNEPGPTGPPSDVGDTGLDTDQPMDMEEGGGGELPPPGDVDPEMGGLGAGAPEEKYSAQALRKIHDDFHQLLQDYDQILEHNEHPEIGNYIRKILENLVSMIEEVEALFSQHHPDHEPLGLGMGGGEEPGMGGEEEAGGPPPMEGMEGEEPPGEVDLGETDEPVEGADSEEPKLPEPEEVAEGMRKTPRGGMKSLPKVNRAEGTEVLEGKQKVPRGQNHSVTNIPKPHSLPEQTWRKSLELQDHEHDHVSSARDHLKELALPNSVHDEYSRMKAFHHHMVLKHISEMEGAQSLSGDKNNIPGDEEEKEEREGKKPYGKGGKKKDEERDEENSDFEGSKGHDKEEGSEREEKGLPSEEADVSPEKAKKILRDGKIRNKPLSDAQRGMFGAIAGRGEKSAPGSPDWHREQHPDAEQAIESSHRKICGEASQFFRELSVTKDFGEPHRYRAHHYHGLLDGIVNGGRNPNEEGGIEKEEKGEGKKKENKEESGKTSEGIKEEKEMKGEEKSLDILALEAHEKQSRDLAELTKTIDLLNQRLGLNSVSHN